MPSPHANAHAHQHSGSVSAASNTTTLPQSAFNFNLNSASASNLSQASFSNNSTTFNSLSNPTSRSTTPASQLTLGSSRKPSQYNNPHNHHNLQPLPPPPQQQHHNFHHHYQQQFHHDPSAAHVSRPIYGSVQYNPAHRPSHIANSVNLTPSSFSSGSLPRTSSLLPPPSLAVDQSSSSWDQPAYHDPFSNAPAAVPVPTDPVNDREFDDSVSPKNTRRRHSKSHSRSSSLGGLSDGFRNLNRWSISTSSSRASNPASASAKRFSRRMSIDSTALFSQSSSASPRRLHKSRPSTAGGSPEDARHHYQQQPSVPPLTSLPPIVQLPSLSQDDLVGAALSGRDPKPDRTTIFPGPGAESESGTFWDDSSRAGETSYLSTSARNTPDSTLPTSTFSRDANMPHPEDAPAHREKGHSRSRSQGLKSSTDSTSSQRNPSRSKQPSQKAMLSRALQKANTAVQLDNAQNFQGARSSYREACDLLHQVLLRTAGDEDKKKLEAIRKTYASRIEELDQMLPDEEPESKALPQRPRSNSTSSIPQVTGRTTRNGSVATVDPRDGQPSRLRSDSEMSQASQRPVPNYARPTSVAWRPQHSPKPSLDGSRYVTPTPTNFSEPYTRSQSAFSQTSPRRDRLGQPDTFLARPMEDEYKPPPLSPRRPISPSKYGPDVSIRSDFSSDMSRLAPTPSAQRGHQRGNSHESISWLDPIDESAGSSASSVHSRSSSMGVRRKHIRSASGDTEAEFDAALDDAIEAAYDDGYESTDPTQRGVNLDHVIDEDDVIAQALKKVQLAKERVRQSELEMQRLANDRDRRMKALQEEEQTLPGGFYDGDDSDEEERILEEMTSGYAIENFTLEDQSTRNRMPRESDSSELTSRTWHSSTVSNPPTANTILSPVSESTTVPSLSKSQGPIAPPPSQSLPKLPPGRPPSSGGRDSVRDRRLSGTNAKQLKIETQKLGPKVQEPATAGPMMQSKDSLAGPQQPKTAGFVGQQRQTLGAAPISGPGAARSASQLRGPSPIPPGLAAQGPPPAPPVPAGFDGPIDARSESPAVSRPPALRKNFSSNSLKSMKTRNLSITNIDEFSDGSPGTPLSNQFGSAPAPRLPALPSLPTPVAAAFRDRVTSGSAAGGFHLFDNDIHSPASPGEQDAPSEDAPLPLEPCPTDVMLRPFWLMRALYQTLAHPKGGYISNKLFVPRDAWRVKGVKIKGMEEKTSQCDLLTAALQKLARVDSEDADALLEEMQSFENVLEQAQVFLTRRLGNEVGVQGAGTMFKDADGVFEADGKPVPRNNSVSAKGAFSWRRLRSKTSSTGLNSYGQGGGKNGGATVVGAEGMSLPTLPMTDHPTSKPGKRDAMGVQFSGPNAHYMAALARLFDAAQTIDQIARQVEDPGLRHADKTQVGLELCTRHAAEFFAFYICRFVLQDLTLLLDKFIKRGSEWVMV